MSDTKKPMRTAEFIAPPNTLKMKAGAGGIDEKVISMAQKMIDESRVDYLPQGQRFLAALQEGARMAAAKRGELDDEVLISSMIYPAMQLKATGGMFGYPLITSVATRLIKFLEYIHEPNEDAMDVVSSFTHALQAIMLSGENSQNASENGSQLYEALDEACDRYFEKQAKAPITETEQPVQG